MKTAETENIIPFSPIFSPDMKMSQKLTVAYTNLLAGNLPDPGDRVGVFTSRLNTSGWIELIEQHDQQSFKALKTTSTSEHSSNQVSSDHSQPVSVRIDIIDDMDGIKNFPEGQVING